MDALRVDPGTPRVTRQRGPRACRTCATAKAKCIPSEIDRTKCERCHRLKRECIGQPQSATRRRRKSPRRTRVAVLEQKLDNLVTLLTSSQTVELSDSQTSTIHSAPPSDSPAQISSVPVSVSNTSHASRSPALCFSSEEATETGITPPIVVEKRPAQKAPASNHISLLSDEDSYLDIFRTHMAGHFPFVVIDKGISAQDLKRNKPFLFRTVIMAASYKDVSQQTALGKEIIEYLSRRLLIEGEKNLDLLQGLLVYMSWYQVFYYACGQITSLLQLAIDLVIDLDLNRPPNISEKPKTVSDAMRFIYGHKPNAVSGSLEERRAFLGCFYISSMISSMFRRPDVLRHTPYVDECCQLLIDSNECPTDVYLVRLVQLQKIMNIIRQTLPADGTELRTLRAPMGMYIKSIQKDLESLKCSWKEDIEQKHYLMMHYHCTEAALYEIGLYDVSSSPGYGDHPLQLLETLYSCLESTMALLEQFFSIPTEVYLHLPVATWLHLCNALVLLRRHSFLERNGWDLKHIRNRINLPSVLTRIIEKLYLARDSNIQSRPAEHKDFLSAGILRLKKAREVLLEVLRAEEEKNTSQMQDQPLDDVWIRSYDPTGGDPFLNIDENFWQGLLQDWQFE
ncbi:hypothetical protein VTN00DRAFT_4353 [Thermoascus crustaceus]|uniref:uncharacterized protein n=1 Tax=Thermoascus crustaceus TaxID=5088 RepID=UPI003743B631